MISIDIPRIVFGCVCVGCLVFILLSYVNDDTRNLSGDKFEYLEYDGKLQTEEGSGKLFVGGSEFFSYGIKQKPKIVMFWTSFFGGKNSFLGDEGVRLGYCPVNTCYMTDNRSYTNDSDAFIFHPLDPSENPPVRYPHQYYIYFALESPPHTSVNPTPNFFNLSFTHRMDSDIIADNYLQYFRPELWTSTKQFDDIWTRKTKGAVIFVSNCNTPSGRETYVEILAKDYPVDVVGSCGKIECSKHDKRACDAMVRQYKFYFAFENSICKDYITEKIVRGYEAAALPVVMGGANYSAIFPPNSFINVMDYTTPQDLAKYLTYLSNNKEAYAKHFEWRFKLEYMKLPDYLGLDRVSLCKLCDILHSEPRVHRSYGNFGQWWSDDAHCTQPDWRRIAGLPPAPPVPSVNGFAEGPSEGGVILKTLPFAG